MNDLMKAAVASATLLASAPLAAQTYTLGEQDFADGQTINGVFGFDSQSAGEPEPFNAFRGTDLITGNDFAVSFTFTYAALPVTGASIALGIFDTDSGFAGSQLAAFSINGIDLTGLMNGVFEAKASPNQRYDVYSLVLPESTFASLSTGTAAVRLALKGPNDAGAGNGAGLDFARLSFGGGEAVAGPAPEPATWAMMIAGFALAGASLRRRNRAGAAIRFA